MRLHSCCVLVTSLLLLPAGPLRAGSSPATGSLAVSFSHGGMSWFVDGKRLAATPFASRSYVLPRTEPGTHQLRLTDPTGKALLWEGSFTVQAGSTTRATLLPSGSVSLTALAPGRRGSTSPADDG